MPFVRIEDVQRAWAKRKYLTGGQVFNFTFALDDIVRLNMMLIPEYLFGSCLGGGFVQREANTIFSE